MRQSGLRCHWRPLAGLLDIVPVDPWVQGLFIVQGSSRSGRRGGLEGPGSTGTPIFLQMHFRAQESGGSRPGRWSGQGFRASVS